MNYNKEMNQYLSNLAVLNASLHNLHWNVKGLDFKAVHEYLESLYDDVFEKYDEVAEAMLMHQAKPLVKYSDYLKNATCQELDSSEFSVSEAFAVVKKEVTELSRLALVVRALADEADDFDIVALMEDHQASYVKTLWFIRQALK